MRRYILKLEVGQEINYEKVFTVEEVAVIGKIMGFMGKHHEIPNENGELLNQGLLTAILTNRLGGEYNILTYRMEFDFIKQVWTGERIIAKNKVISLLEKKGKNHIVVESKLYNENDELVLDGVIKGIVLEFE